MQKLLEDLHGGMKMKRIYKYSLKLQEIQSINAPVTKVLCVQMQHGELVLWAEVDTDKASKELLVVIVGTGHEIPENAGQYLSTVQDGSYVWHIYIKGGIQ